ncbi:UDP-galactose transporter [Phytophthora megakarya]|uniref:UDP-galactose transporter n=1 Tax=Phytophthora megakarya TaxID=4795 RepID=A0A225X3C7_9STRA|nr:UDP-galactose transporter [Phytophthora megakarya]
MELSLTALKYASLCILCVQNSLLAILMRLSRVGDFPRFNPATAVFVGEALKLATCFAVLFHEFNALKEPQRRKRMGESFRTITNANELLRVSVPAMLYVVQNNLQYVAVSNLDAPTFQVMYQLKILTTAIFSVVILRRTVLPTQWGAIVTLMMGVALVQLDDSSAAAVKTDQTAQSTTKGLLAVVAACVCSGFAGVYFEKILKGSGSKTTLWERNVQMCFLGLALSGGGLMYNDLGSIMARGFFYGYRPVVWAAISMSAFGGLLTAVVVKYADNILKAFATSIAVVLSVIMSVFVFDKVPTGQFVIGAILVNGSVYIYGKAPEWRKNHLEPILPLTGDNNSKETKHIA